MRCLAIFLFSVDVALCSVCFHGIKQEQATSDAPVPVGEECAGPCWFCQMTTLTDLNDPDSAVDFVAQGCGVGPVRLADVEVSPVKEMIGSETVNDACTLLGLGDATELTCVDDPAAIFAAGIAADPANSVLLDSVEEVVRHRVYMRICCCSGDLCNIPTPRPVTLCHQSAGDLDTGLQPSVASCPGPCINVQLVTNGENRKSEWLSQGCGSGMRDVGQVLPPNVASIADLSDLSVVNVCGLLGITLDDQTVCVTSPKQLLKALIPNETLRGSNFVRFIEAIDQVRVCCCKGDLCNSMPSKLQ